MPDPRGHVRSGQPLALAAEQVNWINAQMRGNSGFGAEAMGDAGWADRVPNYVMIRNSSGHAVPRFGVLGISGVAIDPSGGTLDGSNAASNRAREFAFRPVLTGTTPATPDHLERFVVLLEPAKPLQIVRGAIGGSFACLVNVIAVSHRFATIKAGDREQLQSTECGVLQLLWKESGTGPKKWAVGVM
jgi:hypothetical protein